MEIQFPPDRLTLIPIAAAVGLSVEHLYDLRDRPSDSRMTLSIQQASALAKQLNVTLFQFLDIDGASIAPISPEELRLLINEHIQKSHISRTTLEDEIGWDFRAVCDDPERFYSNYTFDAVSDFADFFNFPASSLLIGYEFAEQGAAANPYPLRS